MYFSNDQIHFFYVPTHLAHGCSRGGNNIKLIQCPIDLFYPAYTYCSALNINPSSTGLLCM